MAEGKMNKDWTRDDFEGWDFVDANDYLVDITNVQKDAAAVAFNDIFSNASIGVYLSDGALSAYLWYWDNSYLEVDLYPQILRWLDNYGDAAADARLHLDRFLQALGNLVK